MDLIRPFHGLRPVPDKAAQVAAPPYDVLSSAEARVCGAGRPLSFLHISKAEIDLWEELDPYDDSVYEKAAANLKHLITEGTLRLDSAEGYYAYRLEGDGRSQTGLVVTASLHAYRNNRIKRHEFTQPAKETDRTRHIAALRVQTGPAMLVYPTSLEVDSLLETATSAIPDTIVTTDAGVSHIIWPITEPLFVEQLTRAFNSLPALYIADGHHRCAAAERVARQCAAFLAGAWDGFLAVVFPHHAVHILDYNRVVTDLNGMNEEEFLLAVQQRFHVIPSSGEIRPRMRGEFSLYLPGRWFRLQVHQDRIPRHNPVACLDSSLLSDQILGPILSIVDLRRDPRINFVGGNRGTEELEHRVAAGMAAAFQLYPTTIDDLIVVANSGDVMPPKSTWFEPKLADGLVSYVLEPTGSAPHSGLDFNENSAIRPY